MNRFLVVTTLLMAGACGGESRLQTLDSSIRAPTRPGEPYSLVRAGGYGTDRHDQINEIAISDNYLSFATSWRGVYQIPKFGGGLSVLDDEGDKADYAGVGATVSTVVWGRTNFGSGDFPYTRIKVGTGTDDSSTVINEGPFGVARQNQEPPFIVAGDFLYFLLSPPPGQNVSVVRIPLSGGELTPVVTVETEWDWPNWTADRTGVYFIPYQSTIGPPAKLYSLPSSSGTKALLAEIPGEDFDIVASDDAYVYVTSWVGRVHSMVRVSKADGAQKVILKDLPFNPSTAVSDGQYVYTSLHLSADDVKIIAVSKEGGPTIEIGSDRRFAGVHQMLVDEANLYMLRNNEEILLLPKKPPEMNSP